MSAKSMYFDPQVTFGHDDLATSSILSKYLQTGSEELYKSRLATASRQISRCLTFSVRSSQGQKGSRNPKRFYSDLTPIVNSAFNRRPLEDYHSTLHQWEIRKCANEVLTELDGAQVSINQQL